MEDIFFDNKSVEIVKQNLFKDYLKTLKSPLAPIYEEMFLKAYVYVIKSTKDNQTLGFAAKLDHKLLYFYVKESYSALSFDLFKKFVASYGINEVMVLSDDGLMTFLCLCTEFEIEKQRFSFCDNLMSYADFLSTKKAGLDLKDLFKNNQAFIKINELFFGKGVLKEINYDLEFSYATKHDFKAVARLISLENSDFLKLCDEKQLFVIKAHKLKIGKVVEPSFDYEKILAIGILSDNFGFYKSVSFDVFVDENYRGKGLGSQFLRALKFIANKINLYPLSYCDFYDLPKKQALIKAGLKISRCEITAKLKAV
ncbi:MAG: hypothetical protein BWY78_00515 [Alphaproteobacteria bacterium ADurb.Bin438]|nr:MAG: hypothetical protein BWY78_00515 [Alphaproteobacteria bacterium ADurb.Bin438]